MRAYDGSKVRVCKRLCRRNTLRRVVAQHGGEKVKAVGTEGRHEARQRLQVGAVGSQHAAHTCGWMDVAQSMWLTGAGRASEWKSCAA